MLDKIGQAVDDPGDDDLIRGERQFFEDAVFVGVPRIGEREKESADIGVSNHRKNVGERHVAILRALVIAPADMQPDLIARIFSTALLIVVTTRSTKPRKSLSGRSWYERWRSSARSGQSSWRTNPRLTIVSYSGCNALPSASR